MKKFLCLLLCLCLLCGLAACAVEDTPTKETNQNQKEPTKETIQNQKEPTKETIQNQKEPTKAPEKKDETFKLNETAVFKNLKITASELKESAGKDFFNPADGNVFVGVKFTIENTSQKEQSISSLLSFAAYLDDIKCDYSLSAACVFDEGTLDGSIAPGKKLVGWYAVEISSDWESLEIDVKPDILSNSTAKFVFTK